jgi:hypothetical protein
LSTLTVTFTNKSNVAAADVSIGFAPGASTAATTIVNLNDQSAILPVNQSTGPGNWYTLDSLSKGVGITSFSGRIYVCYGTPWSVAGAGQEPAQAVNDPNFFLRYDKMELTFTGNPNDVADLTSIDYWSIPMSLNTLKSGTVVGTVNGLLPGVTTQQVFSALNALTTPPVSGVAGPGGTDGTPLPALVPGQYTQYPKGPAPGTTFARIIGPSSYPPVYPAPGAIPVMPYDLLGGYLQSLGERFGPGTNPDVIPGLGNGVIAHIAGSFAGVGPNVPASGPQSAQTYSLTARIDFFKNITLEGSTSGMGAVTMLYKAEDLQNPTGIYGGNAPFYLNGSTTPTTPANDVYGWIGGDLFSGLNIGAVGSTVSIGGQVVGTMESHQWFKLPTSSFFAGLQPTEKFYNQWAATLAKLSDAYNFAYTDRFAPVLVSLNPATVDTLEIVHEDATVSMS